MTRGYHIEIMLAFWVTIHKCYYGYQLKMNALHCNIHLTFSKLCLSVKI